MFEKLPRSSLYFIAWSFSYRCRVHFRSVHVLGLSCISPLSFKPLSCHPFKSLFSFPFISAATSVSVILNDATTMPLPHVSDDIANQLKRCVPSSFYRGWFRKKGQRKRNLLTSRVQLFAWHDDATTTVRTATFHTSPDLSGCLLPWKMPDHDLS